MKILPALLALLLSPPFSYAQPAAIFDFHSGFWVNLHHFLYEQAKAPPPSSTGSLKWRRALDYYRANLVKQELLGRGMETINNALSARESAASLKGSGLQPELIAVLEAAAPEYRRRWWPAHDRANHVWIAAVQPLVRQYGQALTAELAAAYQTEWPKEPVRADVTEYADWSGAYTTLFPTHITVSSAAPANAGQAALEVLFHEASHALIQSTTDALFKEVRAQGKLLPRQTAWHALLFYTTGAIVARHLDGYKPYALAHGLFDQGWMGLFPILEKDWKPYLDGNTDREVALKRLVEDYGINPPPKSPLP